MPPAPNWPASSLYFIQTNYSQTFLIHFCRNNFIVAQKYCKTMKNWFATSRYVSCKLFTKRIFQLVTSGSGFPIQNHLAWRFKAILRLVGLHIVIWMREWSKRGYLILGGFLILGWFLGGLLILGGFLIQNRPVRRFKAILGLVCTLLSEWRGGQQKVGERRKSYFL